MKRLVSLGRRRFVLTYRDGRPHSIKERKLRDGKLYNQSYWHSRRPFVRANSIPARVIAAARL